MPGLHLEAAEHGHIGKVLNPAMAGEGGEHYKANCGGLDQQKDHARTLERVKAELV